MHPDATDDVAAPGVTARAEERAFPTSGGAPLVERLLFGAVDLVVVGFAWFTVLEHLWDIANGSVPPLLLVWVVTLPLPVAAMLRWGPARWRGRHRPPGWLGRLPRPTARTAGVIGAALAGVAVVASLLLAQTGPSLWYVGWALAFVATLGGAVVVLMHAPEDDGAAVAEAPDTVGPRRVRAAGAWLALAVGALFAVGSLLTVSPTPDDAYYVNRITWIAEHHTIPDRDTIFTANHAPALYTPAIDTFEVFAGGVAPVLGLRGATVAYLVLGPLLLGMLPLMLWRAIVAVRLRRPLLGLAVGLTFLVVTGGGHQWFGEMVLRRPWQTKEIFAAGVVPLLYAYATEWGRTRRLGPAGLVVAASIASVGLTSTAAGLTPIVLVVLAIGGYLAWGPRFLPPVLVALVYPVVCLLVYGAGDAAAVSSSGAQYTVPFDIWQWFIGIGLVGFTVGAALTVGFLGPLSRSARIVLAVGAVAVVLSLTPDLIHLVGPVLGRRAPAWRLTWVAPLPLLVAGIVSAVDAVPAALGRLAPAAVALVVSAGLVAAFLALETPVTSSTNTQIVSRPAWDINARDLSAARRLDRLAPNGGTVAGPEPVDLAFALMTTRKLALDPRSYYARLVAQRAGRSFRLHDRTQLTLWLQGADTGMTPEHAARLLRAWPVSAVCLSRHIESDVVVVRRSAALRAAGYRPAGSDATCAYYVSTTSPSG